MKRSKLPGMAAPPRREDAPLWVVAYRCGDCGAEFMHIEIVIDGEAERFGMPLEMMICEECDGTLYEVAA